MTARVLSTRALNRALLARQLLLQRSRIPLTRALQRVAGLQTQYAPSAYVSLWSRLHHFHRDALTRALERRRAVQSTLMRATIHVVSARDFPLFAAGLRRGRREWWLRVQRKQLEGIDMEEVAARVRDHLAGGPRRASELQELLLAEGYPRIAAVGAGMWVDLVRVPPSGTWEQRRADLYGLADRWLGPARATEARRGGDPPRAPPWPGLQHEDPALDADLPGGRGGGRFLALREGTGPDGAFRPAPSHRAARARGRGGPPRRPPRAVTTVVQPARLATPQLQRCDSRRPDGVG